MDIALSPLMVPSSHLPSMSLESLVRISNEVSLMEKPPFLQVKNVAMMTRRIKILSSLFEEIQETDTPLPPSLILCFTELFSVIRRLKFLIQRCKENSSLWNLVQTELISNQFHVVVKEMESALDIVPLDLVCITIDTREQVELLRKQAKRVQLFVDPKELERREELLLVMASIGVRSRKAKGVIDFKKVQEILNSIGVRSPLDFEQEIAKLDVEAEKQAGTGGLTVVSNIHNLISLVSLSKSMIFTKKETEKLGENPKQSSSKQQLRSDYDSLSESSTFNIPDEYRCPISLDLMREPVIVATGQTYDRSSISKWINSGHQTCPKSGQRLIHKALIPNYALKCLIHQWCQENNIAIAESSSSYSDLEKSSSNCDNGVDQILNTSTAIDAVKKTANFLVGKLATGSADTKRQAVYEIRLLAKTGMNNRRMIAEAGAIPFLVALLESQDLRIQEHAITGILNLSIFDNNKTQIMAAGSLDGIIQVLRFGKTTESRENAAATLFSLSMKDDYKVTIGAHPEAIPALVELLGDGTAAGKRDATTALFNLAVYNANKATIVLSGAIPLVIDLLVDDKAGVTDEALSVLVLLLRCSEGLREIIRKCDMLLPILVSLLTYGSPKGKEKSITILLGLCGEGEGGEEVSGKLILNPRSISSIQRLAADGSIKARRRADALLRLLNRYIFQSRNPS